MRGFTLVELVVALLIAGVLAGTAAPAYQTMLERQRMRAALNDLLGDIALTRSLAIGRGAIVVLAQADPGAGWDQGWTVFADRNGNRRRDPGEESFHKQAALAHGLHIRAQFTAGTGNSYIAYNAAGRSCRSDNSQAARWGTFTLEAGEQRRHIKINMLGRVRVCDPSTQPDCAGAD
ncbi:GspH/FimT family pseudopilin [Pseudoduganella namucuonensis]|uniref:Type II secretion system protein H n=1 Tax=Pseudoduganella namucuonensis TaxID=1035707 RepID=A0A1I7KW46_9BURK|nr:GspH/FimT family pseudopilin [Pseudoduganella namucuonensis]SFV01524.1 type IV fimbrial biogenesis protein FimT [Pseudoduganella namucuonensis]